MRKSLIFALIPLAVLAIACGSGSGEKDTAGPGVEATAKAAVPADDGKHTIVLEITGAKKADVTYGVDADTSQDNGAKVPWKKTIKQKDYFSITVLAQNKGSGTIKCKITVDGEVVKENEAKGQYAIVTCNAT